MSKPDRTKPLKLLVLLLSVSLLGACASQQNAVSSADRDTVAAMSKAGKAYFDEKCKTVAGEKIYRTVANVEGVLLMKIRPHGTGAELQDPMWPGAAFAIEAYEDSYITSFLGYEYAAGNPDGTRGVVTPKKRGYIATDKRPGGLPGYRYVDVIDAKDGMRYRYTGYYDHPWEREPERYSSKNPYSFWKLKRETAPAPTPRYGVTFEDHVIPEERAMGVASSTVKVVDLTSKEVLGEMIRYAWRPRGIRLTEWQTADKCPGHAVGASGATRKFVDQVLTPKGE